MREQSMAKDKKYFYDTLLEDMRFIEQQQEIEDREARNFFKNLSKERQDAIVSLLNAYTVDNELGEYVKKRVLDS